MSVGDCNRLESQLLKINDMTFKDEDLLLGGRQ